MPALNFEARFAKAVASGLKTQTIRKLRKRPIKSGDRLSLFVGQRTTECKQIGLARCVYVSEVEIDAHVLRVNGIIVASDEARLFAKNDGFKDLAGLQRWFRKRYGLPFFGVLIVWQLEDQQLEK